MATKCVDVFDRSGARLFSCSITLDDQICDDAEFEEMALILAESSGRIDPGEVVYLRACCDRAPLAEAEMVQEKQRTRTRKGGVVSLVQHRIKRARSAAAATGKARQAS